MCEDRERESNRVGKEKLTLSPTNGTPNYFIRRKKFGQTYNMTTQKNKQHFALRNVKFSCFEF